MRRFAFRHCVYGINMFLKFLVKHLRHWVFFGAIWLLHLGIQRKLHGCENYFRHACLKRLILTNADAGKLIRANKTNALKRIETQINELKRMLLNSSPVRNLTQVRVEGLLHRCDDSLNKDSKRRLLKRGMRSTLTG